MQVYAVWTKEGEKALRFPLSGTTLRTIGRAPGNFMQLMDPRVSKRHAAIFRREKEWIIKDCGSRNGVYVNGEQKSQSPVRPGDVVTVGPYTMTLEYDKDDRLPADEVLDLSTQAGLVTMDGRRSTP